MPPKLLVSVRSATEATAALSGGADIIDVKDPDRGSLGRASWQTIADVLETVDASASFAAVSAALGEWHEWDDLDLLRDNSLRVQRDAVFQSPPISLSYVKMGLAGLAATDAEATPTGSWRFRIQHARQTVLACLDGCQTTGSDVRTAPQWVAVAYADYERAVSPSICDVLHDAIACRCPVLLLDTFLKDNSTLLEWQSLSELCRLRAECHQNGIQLALAGRLALPQLLQLRGVAPDIFAVRGAACTAGDRVASVCIDRVRELKHALRE